MSCMLSLLQDRSEGVEFPLELCDATVGFLLSLPTGGRDNTMAASLGASLAWQFRVVGILIASHFQATARFAGAWALGVFAILLIGVVVAAAHGQPLQGPQFYICIPVA